MLIDNISLTSLRVFLEVARPSSMSQAAKNLFMTQPGVSQHIKSLEEQLGVTLFDRVGRSLVLTSKGRELKEQLIPLVGGLSTSLNSISSSEQELRGTINFGMPIEFGNNIILPLLAKWSKRNPQVKFNINYDHITRQTNSMLDGSLDFVIADSFNLSSQLQATALAKEHLVLCCSNDYAKENKINPSISISKLKSLNFVDYLKEGTILSQWFEHHHGKKIDVNIIASLFDVQGMARLIKNDMGLGIVPMHVLRRNKLENLVTIIDERKEPLYNEMSFVQVKNKTMSTGAIKFLEYLQESLK